MPGPYIGMAENRDTKDQSADHKRYAGDGERQWYL